tara:strand:- start:796 stop:1011 length:216 start_codon:yes stop_codon:yes gene_type:complete
MTWILIIVISIMSNDKSWEPRAYEIITKSNFGMCTMAKSDIDYIFRNKNETVVITADCMLEDDFNKKKPSL